jgi:hypothetical protein
MTSKSRSFQMAGRTERLACAVAAATCSSAITGALLLGFAAASPDTWLTPTPALMESMARCDQHPARADRTQCKQQVTARQLAPEPQFPQLARQ